MITSLLHSRPRSVAAMTAPARWLLRLLLGVLLNGVAWVSAWTHSGPLAHYSFFPLWCGFILIVDALTEARSGTSLWRRGHRQFVALFAISAPFWWYFERLNTYVGNWHYLEWRPIGGAEYIFWSSLAFSTVIPGVLAVSELVHTFWRADDAPVSTRRERLPWPIAAAIIAFGFVTLGLSLVFPKQCFPFLWLSLFFILDPLNGALGEDSLIVRARAGAWRGIGRLAVAGLICGFFWEMWNKPSLPKWYYTVPYVGFGKIFEMPALGYGGYLPFALEIFAVYTFARLLTRRFRFFAPDYVRI